MITKTEAQLFLGKFVFVLHDDGDHEGSNSGILREITENGILLDSFGSLTLIVFENIKKIRQREARG